MTLNFGYVVESPVPHETDEDFIFNLIESQDGGMEIELIHKPRPTGVHQKIQIQL